MKRKHTAESKLKLSRETLRHLSEADLQHIVAGTAVRNEQLTDGCVSHLDCAP